MAQPVQPFSSPWQFQAESASPTQVKRGRRVSVLENPKPESYLCPRLSVQASVYHALEAFPKDTVRKNGPWKVSLPTNGLGDHLQQSMVDQNNGVHQTYRCLCKIGAILVPNPMYQFHPLRIELEGAQFYEVLIHPKLNRAVVTAIEGDKKYRLLNAICKVLNEAGEMLFCLPTPPAIISGARLQPIEYTFNIYTGEKKRRSIAVKHELDASR